MENIAQWSELLRPLLKQLAVGDFDVVGISAGAPYAYAVAAAFPDRVKNVFINKGLAAIYKPEVLKLYPDEAASEITIYQKGSLEEIAENLQKNYLTNLTDEQKAIPYIRDSMVGGCMGMAACGKLEFMTDWGFDIEKITQPVYLYHCRDDREVPFALAEKTMEYLPNATMFARDTGGHLSPELMADMMETIKKIHLSAKSGGTQYYGFLS
jgi:pimeloyl-ACP methyl ester carboxylesterase